VEVIAGPCQRDKQQAPFPLQILRASDRIVADAIQLDRAATPIACGSMTSSRQAVTCRTSTSCSASRVRAATIFGRRPCSGER